VHVQRAVAAFGASALPPWLNAPTSRALHTRVIVTMHEVTRNTILLWVLGRVLYRRLSNCCDKIIVHTEAVSNILTGPIGVPATNVIVTPHLDPLPPGPGATTAEFRTRFGLGQARILPAFGFIHVDKGLNDLVCALVILRRSSAAAMDDIRVVIAGAVRPQHGLFRLFEVRDRLHLRRVLREVRHEALQEHIALTRYVSDGDVAARFYTAEAVVLPYRRIEQSGAASLARTFGVPVPASTAGGLGEQFTVSYWTFPPGDPERLAEVLVEFHAAPAGRCVTISRQRLASDLHPVVRETLNVYLAVKQSGGGQIHVG
jgi:glycosyltransferase involved in cell wall biosynthesis